MTAQATGAGQVGAGDVGRPPSCRCARLTDLGTAFLRAKAIDQNPHQPTPLILIPIRLLPYPRDGRGHIEHIIDVGIIPHRARIHRPGKQRGAGRPRRPTGILAVVIIVWWGHQAPRQPVEHTGLPDVDRQPLRKSGNRIGVVGQFDAQRGGFTQPVFDDRENQPIPGGEMAVQSSGPDSRAAGDVVQGRRDTRAQERRIRRVEHLASVACRIGPHGNPLSTSGDRLHIVSGDCLRIILIPKETMRITGTALTEPGHLSGLLTAVSDAEQAGFSRAWLPQMPTLAGTAPWDALTTLALAGQRATRIELGTGVAIAYHQHPLTLARQALTTNAAVGGRLTLGLGVSHPSMIEALGYSYERPAQYLREYLKVLIPALAGEPVDYHGTRLTAVGQVDLPTAPAPAVVLAALGPRMLDLAGSMSDGTITTWTGPKTLEHSIIPRITAAAAAAGRPAPQVVAGLPVMVTPDPEAGRASIATAFAIAGQVPAYRTVLDAEGVSGVADVSIVGDEEHVVAQLRRFAEAGVTEFAAMPYGNPDTVKRTTALLAGMRL